MYKIMYIKTGHVFTLPNDSANELKNKFPEDYKIIEKKCTKMFTEVFLVKLH